MIVAYEANARGGTSRGRRPTYRTATRLARIVHELHARPHGWSFGAIRDALGISERTLLRYLRACREELVDAEGRPLLETVKRGDRRVLRLAPSRPAPESTAYEVLSLYLALEMVRFLDGTVLRQGVENLWDRFCKTLPEPQRHRLANLPKKLYSIPYAPKDYRAFDDTLDVIIRCLVQEHQMRIDYAGLRGEGKLHDFDPYTLALYRGGLYLIGYSHLARTIIWLAVERIRSAEKLPHRFAYPERYSPEKHTEGTFGIIAGEPTRVELLLLNPETAAYLSSRRLHPTQQFRRRRDGTTLLTMRVRGTAELAWWILSLGPWVKVIRPRALREEVGELLEEAAGLYR